MPFEEPLKWLPPDHRRRPEAILSGGQVDGDAASRVTAERVVPPLAGAASGGPYAQKARSRLMLFLAAFLFSTGGLAIKACSLTGWQVASFRSGIAAAVLFFAIPETRGNWTWRTGAAGCAYAATLVSFVVANKLTTSANAIFLQSSAPLYMLFLAPLVLRERVRKADVAVFGAVAAGVFLLLRGAPPATGAADAARGNLVAGFSGFAWAWTMTALRWMGADGRASANRSAAITVVAVGNLIAFAACFPMAVMNGRAATAADVAVLIYLGVFQIGLAYVFLTRSIRHVRGLEATTLLLVEPVFNPVWTWLFRGERPGGLVLAGGGTIVLAAFFGAWWQSRSDR